MTKSSLSLVCFYFIFYSGKFQKNKSIFSPPERLMITLSVGLSEYLVLVLSKWMVHQNLHFGSKVVMVFVGGC